MKKRYYIIILLVFILPRLNAQIMLLEDFETGSLNSMITFQSVGTFNSSPGIKNDTNFGSTKVFGFGTSTCGSNCFANFQTTLIITFPNPAYVDSISWKEMEINGNWGSQGVVLINNIALPNAFLGALPVNSNIPDASPRHQTFAVKQIVTSIKFEVSDITNSSEIIIDDIQIKTISQIAGYEYWFNDDFVNRMTTTVTSTDQLLINQTIPTPGLNQGVNALNFRSFDNLGKYSSVVCHFFYKTSLPENTTSSNVVSYEYWLDNDYSNSVVVNTPVQQQVIVNELIPMSSLSNGLHHFNIRFKDDTGLWSSVNSRFFYKTSLPENTTSSNVVSYEYWLDNDYSNSVVVNTPVQQQVIVNELIPMSSLSNGLHHFNIRFKDDTGLWSSVNSSFFYKTSLPENTTSPNVVSYEYWLNNDYSNSVVVNTPVQQQVFVNELIPMSSLSNGLHHFNIRFKDDTGIWSSVISSFFYKTPEQMSTPNMITEYRYWFDNDFANAVNVSLTPNQQINLIDNLDLTQMQKGLHEINFQFKDTLGKWSVVMTDTIEKISLPIAVFSYSSTQYCDSSIIAFANNSVDGDEYLWDFGDGNTSDSTNPTHAYFNTNTYLVSLTVTDTILNTDSTIVIPIEINLLNTSSIITETACGSYTAPDGQVYTTSGIKTAVIPNAADCDSTITINLTINIVDVSVTQNGLMLTANATAAFYQWLDCNDGYSIINGETSQVFTVTQNGNYAVEVTQNSCIDTTACYLVTTIGILENTFGNEITVYPNPTNGLLKIDLGQVFNEFTVSINDVHGKLLSQSNYKQAKEFEINLYAQSGIYLLTINSGNKKATIRLIKN
jgi:PKD repeat protein